MPTPAELQATSPWAGGPLDGRRPRWDQARDAFCLAISQELEREFTWRAEPFVEAFPSTLEARITVRARVWDADPVSYTWGHWQIDLDSMSNAARHIAHELAAEIRKQPRPARRSSTLTTFDALLRERYRDDVLQDLDITASSALPFLKVEPPKKPAPKPRPARSRWARLLDDEDLV